MRKKYLLPVILVCLMLAMPVSAATKTAKPEKYLTKGDAIAILSASDFIKKKMNQLVSWSIGYDVGAINRVRLVPTFNYILAVPKKVPPDGRTVFEIKAALDNPGGLNSVSGVRADLSSIGKINNMTLVDNGLFGDEKAGDGVYTLQTSINSSVAEGSKNISVTAVNKKGWVAVGNANLDVRKTPIIEQIQVLPENILVREEPVVTVLVRITNPTGIEEVRSVTLDLVSIGQGKINFSRLEGNTFSTNFKLRKDLAPGRYRVKLEVLNSVQGQAISEFEIRIK